MKRSVVAVLAAVMGLVGLAALTMTTSTTASAAPSVPVQWKSVSTAGYTTCGIDVQQKLYCWGYDGDGQLGNGSDDNDSTTTPTKVDDSSWLSVRVAYSNVCAIKTNHTAWCWGSDNYGANGTGTPTGDSNTQTPTKVSGSVQWARIGTGYYSSCGISTSGALYCWGYDAEGAVGDGAGDTSTTEPRRIGTASNWSSVNSGYYGSCAVNTAHQGFCWGDGSDGQNGDGTNDDRFAPKRLPGTWKNINTLALTVCGVTTNNTSKCWGENDYHQAGSSDETTLTVPTTLTKQATTFRRVLSGEYATCGIRAADNAVRCFGYNDYGQFGNGTYDDSTTPVRGAGDKTGWTQLAVGDLTTCGLRTNAKLFCWGYNAYGQTGVEGGETYIPEPHQVGTSHIVLPPEQNAARKRMPATHGPRGL